MLPVTDPNWTIHLVLCIRRCTHFAPHCCFHFSINGYHLMQCNYALFKCKPLPQVIVTTA
uniref:Uncharacterized protein n=1 Tax=Anguilla anguilla TaxID=7936 RepID=A0A0E9QDT5_ANGAN